MYGINLFSTVNKISSIYNKRTQISVHCQKVVSIYDKFMGRVDRFDENIDSQRVSFSSKK